MFHDQRYDSFHMTHSIWLIRYDQVELDNLAYVCEAPIIEGYDDNGIAIPAKPIYPDGPAGGPTEAPSSDGLAGEVIGIIVGICVGVVFIMYGVFAVGKRQGLELGIAAGTVNALGSTIDNAGNSISKCISSI